MNIKKTTTQRGFPGLEFQDRYDKKCCIQKSSLAFEDAIWFGINEPEPMVLAAHAARVGVHTKETTGWVPYPIPNEVLIHTRMHLTRDQVQKLLPILQHFVESGELP